jgi:peroxidase
MNTGYIAASLLAVAVALATAPTTPCEARLRRNYYAGVCPNVESIVRDAVTQKFRQTPATVGATVHLFFHDCFVEGCDASVVVASTAGNTAEKDSPANRALAGDGFDTVIKAKAAVDAVPRCRNRVSCADILAMATRDVIALVLR